MAKRIVELTSEQISFMQESLSYSARAFRAHDYAPAGREWSNKHRHEQEEMIATIRQALADGSPVEQT